MDAFDEVIDHYTKPSRWLPTLDWVIDARHRIEVALGAAIRDCRIMLPTEEILDVGTGAGGYLHLFVGLGAIPNRCHGIDLVAERIRQASMIYPEADFRVGDACDLPYADESFSLVSQFTCLCNIPDPAPAAREMVRVLRPGGHIIWFDLARTKPTTITRPIPDPEELFPDMLCVWRRAVLHPWAEWLGRWAAISAFVERTPVRKQCVLAVFRKPVL